MSKLWIVHRNPRQLLALARLSGLAAPDLVCGEPRDDDFTGASAPAVVLVGLEGDFELELEFLHRHRDHLEHSRLRLLVAPEDVDEARRLFGVEPGEILQGRPSARELRALVLSAVAHRNAESLAERRDRARVAERFAGWFGDLEIPGLLRALDPSLDRVPLLVRGVPGSGRTLVARYVELFRSRGGRGAIARIDAREISGAEDLARWILAGTHTDTPLRTVWIDEIDSLGLAAQRALAEWIRTGAAPAGAGGAGLRWIATAGPEGLSDRLDADLERAFAAISLGVPPLVDHPESMADFAHYVACDWARTVGGTPRLIGASAIEALDAHAWSGDRAAVEATLRSTLAASAHDPIEERDLVSSLPIPSYGRTGRGSSAAPTPLYGRTDRDSSAAPTREEREASERAGPGRAEPIEEAVFVTEDATEATEAEDTAEHRASDSPAEGLDPFEQSFLEGLPDPNANEVSPHDASTQLSDDSFELAERAAALLDDSTGAATREASAASGEVRTRDAGADDTPPTTIRPEPAHGDWRRLARSLSHEIRNPLVSIRTFTELLPEHFSDESFRERFTDLVGRDVARIDEVVSRLASAAEQEKHDSGPVDVSELIEKLLDARRDEIGRGRLLVLRELERDAPIAWADAQGLEVALEGLLDRALASLPERGDLFVATRRIERAADGAPRLRVLLRHHNPGLGASDGSGLEELSSAANVLEYVLAEAIVEAAGGTLTIDSTDAQETLILVDLQTPA